MVSGVHQQRRSVSVRRVLLAWPLPQASLVYCRTNQWLLLQRPSLLYTGSGYGMKLVMRVPTIHSSQLHAALVVSCCTT